MSVTKLQEQNAENNAKGKLGSIATFILLTIFFHGSIGISLLALFTLNIELIIVLTVIILLQKKLKKNQRFADYVSKYMHPAKAFHSFQIIDDCQDAFYPQNNQKVIYGFHPHGVYAMGFLCSMNQSSDFSFSSMTGLSSNFILNLPFMGALLRMWGIAPASNLQVKSLMKKGKTIGLLPGGFEEATITSPNQLRCWIHQRKGFIKYAVEYNYTIRPVLVLKEHQAFSTFQAFQKLRLFLNKLKLPGVFFWNKIWGFVMPTSLDITVLKGRPVNWNPEGTEVEGLSRQEQIDKVHKDYVLQIQRLYFKYQTLNGNKPLKLY